MSTVKIAFEQDCGIYGRKERDGFCTGPLSSFVVFRGDAGNWVIGQRRSGLVIMAMVPQRVRRSKLGLLNYVSEMEKAEPEACAMIGLLDSAQWPDDLKEYGRRLIDWSRDFYPPAIG